MKKYYVTYDDGDDCTTVWVNATSKADAAERVKQEYHDVRSIISVREA